MKKVILCAITASLLIGCETLSGLVDRGAKVNDASIVASETVICKAASIGSILRHYNTKDKAEAWRKLCAQESESQPVIISGEGQ